jgi:hypothetical protein
MAYTWPPTLTEVKALIFRGNSSDTTYDTVLPQFIDAAVAIVENITGPINSTLVTEWHSGGNGVRAQLVLRQRPVIDIVSVTGFIGNMAQPYTQAADPSAATSYSYTLEQETATLTFRVGSGTEYPEPWGVQNVEVIYHAGQATPPANVHLAAIEVVRNLWDMSQQGGRPQYGGPAEDDIVAPWSGYAVTPHVRELLQPNQRIPGIA